ncbi:MerR family DNA-binding transcriptional regulator [Dietzia psychralcaliphila]|uniref:MerR family DNA-binding transcriptional regulator n=1 Tax=Dietzia psychralcaliphila TaxID=139021 RepID=UPI001C1E04B6|nr:MerR family DNA-binding transcriptional regulator [Dietzia psychralcaliphila]
MTFTASQPTAGSEASATGLITVGDVAARSGVAPSAVRFYDNHGVINAVRTASNQRRFDESAACRIQIAKLAQRVGLTVREIAELLGPLPATPEPEDWNRVADMLIFQAEQRVADLRAQLDALGSDAKLCEIGARVEH